MQTHYSRHWLNPPGGGNAYIQTQIEAPDGGDRNWLEAYVNIADCSRNIELDFCAFTDSPLDAATIKLAKLDLLISTLTEFRQAYIESFSRINP